MLLTGGMGIRGRETKMGFPIKAFDGNLAVLCTGMGGRTPLTAHPHLHNCPFYDPETVLQQRGTDGDPEYAMMTPESANPYNARSIQIFLPKGFPLPVPARERLEGILRLMKPLTVNTRVLSTEGPLRIELLDPIEEVLL